MLETLTPKQLVALTERQLDEYLARLGRWKALQSPWATHRERLTHFSAVEAAHAELRRRGAQLSLF